MDSESPLNLSTAHYLLPHINPKGWPIVAVAAVFVLLVAGALLAGWYFKNCRCCLTTLKVLAVPLALLVYGVALFFRDPERFGPADTAAILSPADGIVSSIKKLPFPEELGGGGERWRVSVFMSVLDVHVNRMPASGTIVKKAYVPGKFVNASLDKASKDNERQLYLVKMDDVRELGIVQIAGLIARRIVSFVDEGAKLQRGERFGLIRFGSRLDVYLPEGAEPCVTLGQTAVSGETILSTASK